MHTLRLDASLFSPLFL